MITQYLPYSSFDFWITLPPLTRGFVNFLRTGLHFCLIGRVRWARVGPRPAPRHYPTVLRRARRVRRPPCRAGAGGPVRGAETTLKVRSDRPPRGGLKVTRPTAHSLKLNHSACASPTHECTVLIVMEQLQRPVLHAHLSCRAASDHEQQGPHDHPTFIQSACTYGK